MAISVVNPGEAARVENAAPPVALAAAPAASVPATVDAESLRAQGVQAERTRVSEIRSVTEPFRAQVGEQFVADLIASESRATISTRSPPLWMRRCKPNPKARRIGAAARWPRARA